MLCERKLRTQRVTVLKWGSCSEYQENRTSASRTMLTYSPYILGVTTARWWIKPWKQLNGTNWSLCNQQGPGQPCGILGCHDTDSNRPQKMWRSGRVCQTFILSSPEAQLLCQTWRTKQQAQNCLSHAEQHRAAHSLLGSSYTLDVHLQELNTWVFVFWSIQSCTLY